MSEASKDDLIADIRERVSLLEVTRKFSEDARPLHVVQSKYQILGDDYINAILMVRESLGGESGLGIWEKYPSIILSLQEILSPKVAKEFVDAFIAQNNLG